MGSRVVVLQGGTALQVGRERQWERVKFGGCG